MHRTVLRLPNVSGRARQWGVRAARAVVCRDCVCPRRIMRVIVYYVKAAFTLYVRGKDIRRSDFRKIILYAGEFFRLKLEKSFCNSMLLLQIFHLGQHLR